MVYELHYMPLPWLILVTVVGILAYALGSSRGWRDGYSRGYFDRTIEQAQEKAFAEARRVMMWDDVNRG